MEPARFAVLRDKFTEPRLEHGSASQLHRAHLFRIRINSNDFVTRLSEAGRRHSTYITQSEHTHASHYFSLRIIRNSRLLEMFSVAGNYRFSLPAHLTPRVSRKPPNPPQIPPILVTTPP